MKTHRTDTVEMHLVMAAPDGRKVHRITLSAGDAELIWHVARRMGGTSDDTGSLSWQEVAADQMQAGGVALSVRAARKRLGMTQTALAAELRIPPSNISEIEAGKRTVGVAMAKRLAKVLRSDYRVFL